MTIDNTLLEPGIKKNKQQNPSNLEIKISDRKKELFELENFVLETPVC